MKQIFGKLKSMLGVKPKPIVDASSKHGTESISSATLNKNTPINITVATAKDADDAYVKLAKSGWTGPIYITVLEEETK